MVKTGMLFTREDEEFARRVSLWEKLTSKEVNELREEISEKSKTIKSGSMWLSLSSVADLPESFIKEYENELVWFMISEYQSLSIEFVKEYIHLINFKRLALNEYVSEDLRRNARTIESMRDTFY